MIALPAGCSAQTNLVDIFFSKGSIYIVMGICSFAAYIRYLLQLPVATTLMCSTPIDDNAWVTAFNGLQSNPVLHCPNHSS